MELHNYSNKIKNALLSGHYDPLAQEMIIRGGGSGWNNDNVLVDCNYQPSSYGEPYYNNIKARRPRQQILAGGKETKLMKSLKRVGRNLGHKLLDEGERLGNNMIQRGAKHIEKVGNKYMDSVASQQYNTIASPTFESEYYEGGKSNAFIKSLKRVGNKLGQTVLNEGSKVGQSLIKTGAKSALKMGDAYINNYLSGQMQMGGPQLLESNPELLMAAAGMKQQKRKRAVSDKEKRRHELIRHLMSSNGLTFGEASHIIKAKQLKY